MQALTSLFARQFGTPNYAAHGGFCSVNMAAGMIYTIGGSFWEFGGPDLERAKLFVMIGTAEDHHSNPLKIAIGDFKRARRPLHLDQPGAHRLLGDRRRVDPDPPGHRRRALHGAPARADRERPHRSRVPEALHQRAAARRARRGRARRHVRARPRPGERPAGRWPPSAQQADLRHARRGSDQGGVSRKASPTAPIRRSKATTRSPTAPASRPRSSSCATASRRARRSGRRRSPASAPIASGSSRASSARRRCSRRSSCRSPGPTPGASATRRRRRGRSRSTRCAAWRRTRTAFRPCARWRC